MECIAFGGGSPRGRGGTRHGLVCLRSCIVSFGCLSVVRWLVRSQSLLKIRSENRFYYVVNIIFMIRLKDFLFDISFHYNDKTVFQ